MIKNEPCKIIENGQVKGGARRMSFLFPELSRSVAPGQFVMLRLSGSDVLLRRPFSVHAVDSHSGAVSIAYDARGKGTNLMAQTPIGSSVDVLGPLGSGFDISEFASGSKNKAALICGGIGVFPMIFLANTLHESGHESGVRLDVFAGFRDARAAEAADAFAGRCESLIITSDDGSVGERGLVTDFMRPANEYDAVFACGPAPMLAAVKRLCQRAGQRNAQLCVEERMACGVGACLTCACATPGGGFLRVCADGPVFLADDIEL